MTATVPDATTTSGHNLQAREDVHLTIQQVGARIRARRKKFGLTLQDLGERTGVSVSLLSMLERGATGGSIGTLVAVTSALRLQMYELFQAVDQSVDSPVTKKADQPEIESGGGVLRRVAHYSVEHGLEIAVNRYEPGTASGERSLHHRGHEYGVVVDGTLMVELDGVTHELREGDAISYDSSKPHRIYNVGDGPTQAVWMNVSN